MNTEIYSILKTLQSLYADNNFNVTNDISESHMLEEMAQ